MLVLAIDSTLSNGVGGTVLFASEVSTPITNIHCESVTDIVLLVVCHFDGECLQFTGKIWFIKHRTSKG